MHKRRASIPAFFLYANAALIALACASLGFVGGAVGRLHSLLPEQMTQRGYQPALATEIWSTDRQSDGTVKNTLLARVYKENREYLPLGKIPTQLIQATVAIEDRRFYAHRGISPRDMLRAAAIDLMGGHVQQGARDQCEAS